MNKEGRIYPSIVIRSQAEAMELLEKENNQLQNNWNELKDSLEKDIKEYEESEFHIKEPPLTIQTKIDLLLKMEEIENINQIRYEVEELLEKYKDNVMEALAKNDVDKSIDLIDIINETKQRLKALYGDTTMLN